MGFVPCKIELKCTKPENLSTVSSNPTPKSLKIQQQEQQLKELQAQMAQLMPQNAPALAPAPVSAPVVAPAPAPAPVVAPVVETTVELTEEDYQEMMRATIEGNPPINFPASLQSPTATCGTLPPLPVVLLALLLLPTTKQKSNVFWKELT